MKSLALVLKKLLKFRHWLEIHSDNIPGVPGIGPKTASQLINEYGNIENLIANVKNIKQEKRKEAISENKDLLIISKKLVTLKDDVDPLFQLKN